jgi:hypothetical protein
MTITGENPCVLVQVDLQPIAERCDRCCHRKAENRVFQEVDGYDRLRLGTGVKEKRSGRSRAQCQRRDADPDVSAPRQKIDADESEAEHRCAQQSAGEIECAEFRVIRE